MRLHTKSENKIDDKPTVKYDSNRDHDALRAIQEKRVRQGARIEKGKVLRMIEKERRTEDQCWRATE